MWIDIDWDPVKAAGNAAKHDVSFEEAMMVFDDPWPSRFTTRIAKVRNGG